MTRTSSALPAGWALRVSRSKGRVYYVHAATGETRWTRPEAEPLTASAAIAAPVAAAPSAVPAATGARSAPESRPPKRQRADAPSTAGDARRAAIIRCMRVGASTSTARFEPWEHQLEAIERLLDALDVAPGRGTERFLFQHATGSGKTMTIAALVCQLLELVDHRGGQRFHTIVLMIDRVKLDQQVGDLVEQFLRRNGLDCVHRVASIDHLASVLSPQGTADRSQRVIITTVQKMALLAQNAVLLARLLHLRDADEGGNARMAMLTDEAHRSHTTATREMIETVMRAGEEARHSPLFIGFTATPNPEALRLFGTRSNGVMRPFHCYSMAQAIADGLVRNVVGAYTSVHCRIEMAVPRETRRELLEQGRWRAIMDIASADDGVMKAKVLYMMRDFDELKRAWARAKCMVVARSRRDVVRYHQLLMAYVRNSQKPWRVFAVFSGSVQASVPGVSSRGDNPSMVSEQSLNDSSLTLSVSDIVVVCDKLDTGYSDALLTRMYVDRYLRSSIQTVQLFSRLNRQHPDKPPVKIVDFANHPAHVRLHFARFWSDTQVADALSPDPSTIKREVATSVTILGDHLKPWASGCDHIDEAVKSCIISLDRDSFLQLVDAARQITAWKRDSDWIQEQLAPFDWELVERVQCALQAANTVDPVTDDDVQEVASHMRSRVANFDIVFEDALYPASLANMDVPLSQAGSLEEFEARLRSFRPNIQREKCNDRSIPVLPVTNDCIRNHINSIADSNEATPCSIE